MKIDYSQYVITFSCAILMISAGIAFAAGDASEVKKAAKKSEVREIKKQTLFVYKPPMRGAPRARIGGGTRGKSVADLELFLLTPDHIAHTSKAQPTLYWYVSEPGEALYEIALIEDKTLKTVIEGRLDNIVEPGIHEIPLEKFNVTLTPGVVYQWFVTLIIDAEQRSRDIVASGMIERIEPSPEQKAQLHLADRVSEQQVAVYAQEGFWYDALSSISELIESHPKRHQYRSLRASLLEQVGLQEVATFDRDATSQ